MDFSTTPCTLEKVIPYRTFLLIGYVVLILSLGFIFHLIATFILERLDMMRVNQVDILAIDPDEKGSAQTDHTLDEHLSMAMFGNGKKDAVVVEESAVSPKYEFSTQDTEAASGKDEVELTTLQTNQTNH